MKEESEKVGLKINIQKTKIMTSSPITSWEIDGETVSDFIFEGSTITADGDCSHEIKGHLLLGRKVMTNLDTDGRESQWTPGVGDGQRGLSCCDSRGCKELDMTEWLNWTELNILLYIRTASCLSILPLTETWVASMSSMSYVLQWTLGCMHLFKLDYYLFWIYAEEWDCWTMG